MGTLHEAVDVYVGFDSAWADNPKAPGAICALAGTQFYPPRLASFTDALAFICEVQSPDGVTLIAIDQPTIVRNATGARPADRLAASLMSFLGGGVQPANTGRLGMFCAEAPIWRFLDAIGAVQDPERARTRASGMFVMEVFPAMAVAAYGFFGRRAAPRYNPARRATFRSDDWLRVAEAAAAEAASLGVPALAHWCRQQTRTDRPRKADQDRLDAAICLLIALRWRLRPRADSVMLGDLDDGYVVSPASSAVRDRLAVAARRLGVALDGVLFQQGA